jgi:hypothetical protein
MPSNVMLVLLLTLLALIVALLYLTHWVRTLCREVRGLVNTLYLMRIREGDE